MNLYCSTTEEVVVAADCNQSSPTIHRRMATMMKTKKMPAENPPAQKTVRLPTPG